MDYKEIIINNNKKIHIYDNLFTYQERLAFMEFLQRSFFKVNGTDYDYRDNQCYSAYTAQDLHMMNFLQTDGFKKLNEKYHLEGRDIKQIRVNFSTVAEKNRVHEDTTPITLLYYANTTWELDWGGHTFFLSEDLKDILYTCEYKPGRVVVFNGTIPHMIMAPSILALKSRFSVGIQYYGDHIE